LIKALDIPAELDDWVAANPRVLEHVHQALKTADAPLTEIQLWNLVASSYSPEWSEANQNLRTAEQRVRILKSDENRPLGLIGNALEGEAVTDVQSGYMTALIDFTIVNETLHQDPSLQTLMKSLVASQGVLEESLRLSRETAALTASFARASEPPNQNIDLGNAFRYFARRMFKPKPAKAATPKSDAVA